MSRNIIALVSVILLMLQLLNVCFITSNPIASFFFVMYGYFFRNFTVLLPERPECFLLKNIFRRDFILAILEEIFSSCEELIMEQWMGEPLGVPAPFHYVHAKCSVLLLQFHNVQF